MKRFLALLVFACLLFASGFGDDGQIGYEIYCADKSCYLGGSATILSIPVSLLMAAFAIWFPRAEFTRNRHMPVVMWRRISAIIIDFVIVGSALLPILTLPTLIAEAVYTGEFAWTFEREYVRSTDLIFAVPPVLIMFAAVYLYSYLHMKSGRQTIGQYILGFVVEGKADPVSEPRFGKRVFLACFSMFMWPIAVHIAHRREDKLFWWENATDTRVTSVTLR